jgi:hypothetical protein
MKLDKNLIMILTIIIIVLIAFAKPIKKLMTRGYINKNPGNIRKTPDFWKGEIQGTDKDFKTFQSMPYGYRAMFVLLSSYFHKYKLNTIEKIINTYAPGNENNTEAYINAVCQRTGFARDMVLDFGDTDSIKSLIAAISYVENGVKADMNDITAGFNLYYS